MMRKILATVGLTAMLVIGGGVGAHAADNGTQAQCGPSHFPNPPVFCVL